MRRSVATRLTLGAALAATATLLLPGCSVPAKRAEAPPPTSADAAHNFGFPLGFSPSKMDTTADPRQDFRRYAGGRWLDAAQIPADKLKVSGYLVMQEKVETQLRDLLQEAARTSGSAPKGSPAQQVGDFYASGMYVEHLKSLGVRPLVPELERIAKAQGPTALAEALARLQMITGDSVMIAALVAPHPMDRDRARADARLRLAGAALRRAGQRARLVDASRRAALRRRDREAREAGRRVGAAVARQDQRGSDAADPAGRSAPARRAFHEAFGIRAGDRMWLDPNDRVTIW